MQQLKRTEVKMKKNINLLFIYILILVSSCVGTIDQELPEFTQSSDAFTNPNFSFNGLSDGSVKAIAHNKVLLRFWPASGGSGNFSYRVYLNSDFSSVATSYGASQIHRNYLGQYELVVNNLDRSANYAFTVRAFDAESFKEDLNTHQLEARTFSFYVPDFDGVDEVTNLSGIEASSGLKASWFEATTPVDDPFSISPYRPVGYKVYYSASPINLLENTSSVNFKSTNSSAQVEDVINGLSEDTFFYFLVRAVAANGSEDQNEKVFEAKTLLETNEINFDGLTNVAVDTTSCSSASVDLSWNLGSGSYNRYKIVRRTQPFNQLTFDHNVDRSSDTSWNIQLLSNLNITNYKAVGLNFNQDYYFAVYACNSSTNICQNSHPSAEASRVTPIRVQATIDNISFEDSSLDDVVLRFQTPQNSCFDKIVIYRHDSATDPNKTEVNSFSNPIRLDTSDLRNSEFTRVVIDLEVAQAYHFSAETELDGISSQSSNIYTFDGTTKPIYNFQSFVCDQDSVTQEFKCTWAIESQSGDTYESFKSQYRNFAIAYASYPNEGTPYSISESEFTCSGVVCESSNSDHIVITPINISQLEHVFTTPLSPGRTHAFRLIADTNIPGLDDFTMQTSAFAPQLTATHQGWFNFIALGPKVKRNVLIDEYMEVDSSTHLVYPKVALAPSQGVSSSNRGIVSLEWNDFSLSTGESFYDFYNNLTDGSEAKNKSGYKVYRKEALFENEVVSNDHNSSGWVEVTTGYIVPQALDTEQLEGVIEKKFARFVDYTASTGDPIPSGGEDVTYRPTNNTTTGKAYYYKVILFIDDQEISMTSSAEYNEISIPKIIIPPNNMALVHPWIANAAACKLMQKTSDPLNNYRCEYDGLGHTDVNGSKYLDQNGYLFIDRFEMGINYSRGNSNDPTDGCRVISGETLTSDNSQPIEHFFYGHPNHPRVTGSNPFVDPNVDSTATDLSVGDCVGSKSPARLRLEAKQGTVFMIHPYNSAAYVQIDSGVGSTWRLTGTVDSGSAIGENEDFEHMFSNQAGLHPMKNQSLISVPKFCSHHKVNLKYGSSNFTSAIDKKLMSRREQVAASDYQPQVLNVDMNDYFDGRDNGKCNSWFAYNNANNYFENSISSGYVNRFGGNLTDQSLRIKYFKYIRTNPFSSSSRSGFNNVNSSLITGSDELDSKGLQSLYFYDSSQCVSRYGIQDLFGNVKESLRDKTVCNFDTNNDLFCSMGYTNVATQAGPFFGPYGEVQNDWLNGDGKYLSFSRIDNFDTGSTNILGAISRNNVNIGSWANEFSGFFNTLLGMPLGVNANLDNAITTVQNNSVPGVTQNFNFSFQETRINDSILASMFLRGYNDRSWMHYNSGTGTFNYLTRDVYMTSGGGSTGDGAHRGRWGMSFGSADSNLGTGGRCSVLIEY